MRPVFANEGEKKAKFCAKGAAVRIAAWRIGGGVFIVKVIILIVIVVVAWDLRVLLTLFKPL